MRKSIGRELKMCLGLAACIAVQVCSGEAEDLLKLVKNPNSSISQKEAALEDFDAAKMDGATAVQLILLLKSGDTDFADPLLTVAVREAFPETLKTLNDVLESVSDDAKRSRAIFEAATCVRAVNASLARQQALARVMLKSLQKGVATMGWLEAHFEPAGAAGEMVCLPGWLPEEFKTLVVSGMTNGAIGVEWGAAWLQNQYVAPALNDRDFAALAILSEKSAKNANALDGILAKVAHQKSTQAWTGWLNSQKPPFVLLDTAERVAQDGAQAPESRAFALEQLRQDLVPEPRREAAHKVALTLLMDKSQPGIVRNAALKALALSPRAQTDPAERAKTLDLLAGLIVDKSVRADAIRWMGGVPGGFENPETVARIASLLGDGSIDLSERAGIGYAISEKARGEALNAALLQLFREIDQKLNLTMSALDRATGARLGMDAAAWRERARGQARLKAEPAPQIAEKAAPPATWVGLDGLAVEAHGQMDEKGDWTAKRTFIADLTLHWPINMHTLAVTGYVVEEIQTDAGPQPKPDWQLTSVSPISVHYWAAKKKAAPAKDDRPPQRPLQMSLGSPNGVFQKLELLKGYLLVKQAAQSRMLELNPAGDFLGKPVELAQVKDLSLSITEVEPGVMRVLHSRKPEKNMQLRSLEFLDSKGERIPWVCATHAAGMASKEGLTFELKLEKPLPKDGVILLDLFQDVQDLRVPFEFRELRFDLSAVRPPKAPEF